MICLLSFYVLFSFTNLRIFIVMTYTIKLKLFRTKLFSYFLTLIHRLKTCTFVYSHCSKWYNILLASLSTNQEPIRSNPPRLSPPRCALCPNQKKTIGLCIVSHYHWNRLWQSSTRSADIQRTRTQFARRAFSACGLALWYSLSPDIRTIDLDHAFGRSLKSHLAYFAKFLTLSRA